MVEVDPVVLIAAGTAVFGLATVVLCLRPSSKSNDSNDQSNASKSKVNDQVEKGSSNSKGKKKSKATKSKSSSKSNTIQQVKSVTFTSEQVIRGQDENEDVVENGVEESTAAADDEAMTLVITEEQEALLKKAKKAKETPEQKAARLDRQKLLKNASSSTSSIAKRDEDLIISSYSAVSTMEDGQQTQSPPVFDGWAVVEDKRKVKTKESAAPSEESSTITSHAVVATPAATTAVNNNVPVAESVSSQITVESKKVGLLIGQKGKTKLALQRATDTEITMPKVDKEFTGPVEIIVTGPLDGVNNCIHALNELVTKGYCNLLADADFHEGYVAVNPKHLPIIIGPKGAHIKAIESHTSVKITTPTGFSKTAPNGENILPSKVKIGLAGSRDKLTIARNLILELIKYQHTIITHPNIIHIEMDIASNYYNFIIGSKGSEIKHIQANYKVTVIIPNAESGHEKLLILGEETAVLNAEKHILKVIEKAETQIAERAKAEAEGIALGDNAKAKYAANLNNPKNKGVDNVANNSNASTATNLTTHNPKEHDRKPRIEKEEPEEEWVKDFAPRQRLLPLGSMLPATAKFAAAPTSSPPAANVSPIVSEVAATILGSSTIAVTSEAVKSLASTETTTIKAESITVSESSSAVLPSGVPEFAEDEKVVGESVDNGTVDSSTVSASAWGGGRSALAATAKLY